MEKFLNSTKRLIFHRQKDILSSAIIISSMILISRFFGFIRYRTLATYFTKEELDIFFASFRIPDFMFEVLITGALSSAFIPIFIKYSKNKDLLNRNISSIINLLIGIMFVSIILLFVTAEYTIPLITPGFTPNQIELVIGYSRLLLLAQLPFLVLGNILSGIAQANRIFIVTAFAPVLYNIGIITGTILLSESLYMYGPFIGVIGGAFMFFIVQIPILYRVGFSFLPRNLNRAVLKEFFSLFVPRVMSVLATQIDLTIDLTLSTLLGSGSYTIFFFSQHLQLFPVSFVGMAFGQASLPYLSDLFNNNKIREMRKLFVDSILQLFYLSIPLSLFLIWARTPIVRLVFGGKKFDWAGTNLTALTVSLFALSIPFHTIFYFVTRAFYATHDTKTPFIVNFTSVLINTIISIYFVIVLKWPVWALALSFSITITFNVIVLLACYYSKLGGYDVKKLIKNTIAICMISILSAIPAYVILKMMDVLILNTTRTISVFFLISFSAFIYLCIYIFLSWVFEVEEVYILTRLIIKIKEARHKIYKVYSEVNV